MALLCAQAGTWMRSAVTALPVLSWASRFRSGDVLLEGIARGALQLPDGRRLGLEGPLRVDFSFVAGGQPPSLRGLVLSGAMCLDGEPVTELFLEGEARPDRVLEAVVALLADLRAEACAWPDGELVVAFGSGLEVTIPADQPLTVTGATRGSPQALRLIAPLTVAVPGASLRLRQERLRWLTALAGITVTRATLHPDGRVDLEGGGRNGLVRTGLVHTSTVLSGLVRHSPRFARLRSFLSA